MKIVFLFFVLLSSLFSSQIKQCSEYGKVAKNVVGKSRPVNMMIQSVYELKFPDKISNKVDPFKKLESVEDLLNKKVDLVVLWNSKGNYSKLANKLEKVGIDSCSIDLTTIESYIQGYKTLGKVMGKEDRGNSLSKYIQKELANINQLTKKIPNNDLLNVYYAKSDDGLVTECEDSVHSEAIKLINAKNPIKCNDLKNMRITINLEQLFLINPDVIITNKKNFYKDVFSNNKYRYLKAVKDKKVFLIPQKPINWIDNPPSFFKTLGAYWLGSKVYPKYFPNNFDKKKEEFYQLFLNRSYDE